MKKLILLLIVLATSCNQEANTKYFMHEYVGDYQTTVNFNGREEIIEASVGKINGQYYLTLVDWKSFKLDSSSRKNTIHDSSGYGDVEVAEILFEDNIEVIYYWLLSDPTDTILQPLQDTYSFSFKKPHQN